MRALYLAGSAAALAAQAGVTAAWLRAHGSLGAALAHAWGAATADAMTALVLADLCALSAAALAWMAADGRRRGMGRGAVCLWTASAVVFGSTALLAWLGLRPRLCLRTPDRAGRSAGGAAARRDDESMPLRIVEEEQRRGCVPAARPGDGRSSQTEPRRTPPA